MGWKASLVIIENINELKNDWDILKAIGKDGYVFKEEVIFKDCLSPKDRSINIGYYNNNIIIADDYQLTNKFLDKKTNLDLITEEKRLCKLFPTSEIISVACHSVVDYHAYSLIQNSEKVRLKSISVDDPFIEFGERTIEEEIIYSKSIRKKGANFWKNSEDPSYEYTEEQMMEEFTFGFAARRLGVYLDDDADELMDTIFKKYRKPSFFRNFLNRLKK
jgi:hypothetical protein